MSFMACPVCGSFLHSFNAFFCDACWKNEQIAKLQLIDLIRKKHLPDSGLTIPPISIEKTETNKESDETLARYELLAEAFYQETGMMAPGKDCAAAASSYSMDERWNAWERWMSIRQKTFDEP